MIPPLSRDKPAPRSMARRGPSPDTGAANPGAPATHDADETGADSGMGGGAAPRQKRTFVDARQPDCLPVASAVSLWALSAKIMEWCDELLRTSHHPADAPAPLEDPPRPATENARRGVTRYGLAEECWRRGAVVGAGFVPAVVGIVVHGGSDRAGGDAAVGDSVGHQVAGEDVVDELWTAPVDPG